MRVGAAPANAQSCAPPATVCGGGYSATGSTGRSFLLRPSRYSARPSVEQLARTRGSARPPGRSITPRRRRGARAATGPAESKTALAWTTKVSCLCGEVVATPLHDRRPSPINDRYSVSSQLPNQPAWAVHLERRSGKQSDHQEAKEGENGSIYQIEGNFCGPPQHER